jgi:hypothetical protein
MLDYDHEIIYNKDKENVVSDTLSMKYDEEGSIFSLSFLMPNWLWVVYQEWSNDAKIMRMIH